MKKNIETIVVEVDEETKRINDEWKKETDKLLARLNKRLKNGPVEAQKERDDNLYKSADWTRLRALKLKENETCPFCGKKTTDVHHVIEFSRQGPDQKKDVFSAEFNLMAICEKCHYRVHHNKLNKVEKDWYNNYKLCVNKQFLDNGIIPRWL